MRQSHMQHMRFAAPQVGIRVGTPTGDRLEGERRDEFFSGRGEHHIHERASLRQLGRQISGLKSRDGAFARSNVS